MCRWVPAPPYETHSADQIMRRSSSGSRLKNGEAACGSGGGRGGGEEEGLGSLAEVMVSLLSLSTSTVPRREVVAE